MVVPCDIKRPSTASTGLPGTKRGTKKTIVTLIHTTSI